MTSFIGHHLWYKGRPPVWLMWRQSSGRSMNWVVLALVFGSLVHQTTCASQESITLSCPALQPCTTALASHNPVTLKCEDQPENTLVYWQYLDIFQPDAQPVTLIQSSDSDPQDEDLNSQEHLKVLDLMSRSEILSGDLKLLSPRVQDIGIYTCWDGGIPLAQYEIDFQDSENIHISHASLGHRVRPNATIDLGVMGTLEVFTVWGDWQPCDRCGMLGERKKLGFCYCKITRYTTVVEEPQPCGLLQSSFGQIQFNCTPELRIEMCLGACKEVEPAEDVTILLDKYHTYLHADAVLKCPTASIYKPVYWEHGSRSFTRLKQMRKKAKYVLDKTTGGGTLFIPNLHKSSEGIYKCYIDRRLVGKFQVMFAKNDNTTAPQHYTMVESTIIGMFIFLGTLLVLSLLLSCIETTNVRFTRTS